MLLLLLSICAFVGANQADVTLTSEAGAVPHSCVIRKGTGQALEWTCPMVYDAGATCHADRGETADILLTSNGQNCTISMGNEASVRLRHDGTFQLRSTYCFQPLAASVRLPTESQPRDNRVR